MFDGLENYSVLIKNTLIKKTIFCLDAIKSVGKVKTGTKNIKLKTTSKVIKSNFLSFVSLPFHRDTAGNNIICTKRCRGNKLRRRGESPGGRKSKDFMLCDAVTMRSAKGLPGIGKLSVDRDLFFFYGYVSAV